MATPRPATAPLLDLNTLVEHPTVAMDGVAYDLLLPDNLSLVAYQRLSHLLPRLEELWLKAKMGVDLTDDENEELEGAFGNVCRIIWKAPEDVQARLTNIQRIAIYQTFLTLPSATLRRMGALAMARTTKTTAPSTGAKSSLSSSGSIQGRRSRPGSTARPSASSVPA